MLVDILQITIPTVVVMLTAYLIIKKFFENARHEREEDFKRKSLEQLLPLRLQAYERLVLYLERITKLPGVMRSK